MTDRPRQCKFWDHIDVLNWIRENVPASNGGDDPRAAALWWMAVKQSESIGDMNTRERASMFLDGITPTSMDDIDNELQAPYEDQDITPEFVHEVDALTVTDLRVHFGLPARSL